MVQWAPKPYSNDQGPYSIEPYFGSLIDPFKEPVKGALLYYSRNNIGICMKGSPKP